MDAAAVLGAWAASAELREEMARHELAKAEAEAAAGEFTRSIYLPLLVISGQLLTDCCDASSGGGSGSSNSSSGG